MVRDLLFTEVETALNSDLDLGLKFDREFVSLGKIPLKITGIKVYDEKTSRKEIMMDIDFLYASEMELLFSFKGFPLGISDFHLRGTVRVVLKPLLCKFPIIGGLQIYCLEAPEIDYKLRGMAGALDFFHIGGLSQLIKDAINEQVIKNFVVFVWQ